jgi:hypothetical protein
MGLKEKIGRLKRAMEGRVDYIELDDGSRCFYEPGEVWSQLFKHGSDCLTADYRSEPRPEPPEILEAVAKAKDRRSAGERLYGPNSYPFMGYDLESLVERGEFVPRSFLAGHSYEESLEHFARKNEEKE